MGARRASAASPAFSLPALAHPPCAPCDRHALPLDSLQTPAWRQALAAIILPLDTSDAAASAAPFAAAFARALHLPLVLVAAWDGTDQDLAGRLTSVQAEELRRVAVSSYQQCLDTVATRLRETGVDPVATAVRIGRPADEILQAAAETGASFIVMATHGRGGLGRALFGSVADRVIRATTVPVLLVRPAAGEAARPFAPRRLLAPLDGSDAAEHALPVAAQVAAAFGAGLTLLQVIPVIAGELGVPGLDPALAIDLEESIADAAARYLERLCEPLPAARPAIRRGEPARAILDFVTEEGIDLVVMGTHGRSGLARWTLGSVAGHVLGASRAPVLLVPTRG